MLCIFRHRVIKSYLDIHSHTLLFFWWTVVDPSHELLLKAVLGFLFGQTQSNSTYVLNDTSLLLQHCTIATRLTSNVSVQYSYQFSVAQSITWLNHHALASKHVNLSSIINRLVYVGSETLSYSNVKSEPISYSEGGVAYVPHSQ